MIGSIIENIGDFSKHKIILSYVKSFIEKVIIIENI